MSRLALCAGLGLAACLLAGTPARGATISGLVLSDASTSAYDDVGPIGSAAQSSASVTASDAGGFGVHYAAGVAADTGGAGGGSFTQGFTGSFTITFAVTESAGLAWAVNVDVVRSGALTIVSDGNGTANVTLDALGVVHSGAGVLGASLDLGAVGPLDNAGAPGTSPDQAFSQASAASISGVGTGSAQLVTLVFTFTASASTVDPAGGLVQGDEAALRMGLDSALMGFTADDYPGPGGRALAGDGIAVTAVAAILPEPRADLLLALGLIALAWFDPPRSRRR
jgi:hypothetical protein